MKTVQDVTTPGGAMHMEMNTDMRLKDADQAENFPQINRNRGFEIKRTAAAFLLAMGLPPDGNARQRITTAEQTTAVQKSAVAAGVIHPISIARVRFPLLLRGV